MEMGVCKRVCKTSAIWDKWLHIQSGADGWDQHRTWKYRKNNIYINSRPVDWVTSAAIKEVIKDWYECQLSEKMEEIMLSLRGRVDGHFLKHSWISVILACLVPGERRRWLNNKHSGALGRQMIAELCKYSHHSPSNLKFQQWRALNSHFNCHCGAFLRPWRYLCFLPLELN